MKINNSDLTRIEETRHVTVIQSDYPEIAYAVDRKHNAMWVINRQTGAQIEIDGGNVYSFADEIMSVAEVYLTGNGLRKGA